MKFLHLQNVDIKLPDNIIKVSEVLFVCFSIFLVPFFKFFCCVFTSNTIIFTLFYFVYSPPVCASANLPWRGHFDEYISSSHWSMISTTGHTSPIQFFPFVSSGASVKNYKPLHLHNFLHHHFFLLLCSFAPLVINWRILIVPCQYADILLTHPSHLSFSTTHPMYFFVYLTWNVIYCTSC